MKEILFLVLFAGFLVACGGGEQPQDTVPSTEVKEAMDAVEQEVTEEVSKEVEELKKEGEELDKDLQELDNL
ncbi:MAG: hypothetical protein AB8E82_19830 [Aureispira sp.]